MRSLALLAFVQSSGVVAERHPWIIRPTIIGEESFLPWCDAREEGDLVTAELMFAEAMRYFDEEDRLAERWRNFEAYLDEDSSRRRRKAA
jgi:hypothetical protein